MDGDQGGGGRVMAVNDRTRRLLPTVLVALALLLGMCFVIAPASASTGDQRSVNSPAATAVVPAAIAHAVRRGADPGTQSRPNWQRHAGGPSPVTAAVLLAALIAGLSRFRWSSRRGPSAGPAAGGRFARDSRAPPEGRPLTA